MANPSSFQCVRNGSTLLYCSIIRILLLNNCNVAFSQSASLPKYENPSPPYPFPNRQSQQQCLTFLPQELNGRGYFPATCNFLFSLRERRGFFQANKVITNYYYVQYYMNVLVGNKKKQNWSSMKLWLLQDFQTSQAAASKTCLYDFDRRICQNFLLDHKDVGICNL